MVKITTTDFNIGFVCSEGRCRSPTGSKLYKDICAETLHMGIHSRYRDNLQLRYMIETCQYIFCMEQHHKNALDQFIKNHPEITPLPKVYVLGIQDIYMTDDPILIKKIKGTVDSILGIGKIKYGSGGHQCGRCGITWGPTKGPDLCSVFLDCPRCLHKGQ